MESASNEFIIEADALAEARSLDMVALIALDALLIIEIQTYLQQIKQQLFMDHNGTAEAATY